MVWKRCPDLQWVFHECRDYFSSESGEGKNRTELLLHVWERYFISLSDFEVPVEESFVVAVAKDGWMVST